MMKKTVVLIALIMEFAFCQTASADNVIYSNNERELARDNSLFFDRNGALYPAPAIEIPIGDLQVETSVSYEWLSLKGYYRTHYDKKDDVWLKLLDAYGLDDTARDFETAWRQVQDKLRDRAVERLNAATNNGQRPLFILVHGFNNTFLDARSWYRIARHDIESRVKAPVFVEVFWDGGKEVPAPVVWGVGQNNFRLVGLEFRRYLSHIHPNTAIRILTHSSGGPLIANALGDASAPFGHADPRSTAEQYEKYFDRANDLDGAYAPPVRRNMRVAMVVPAGAANTFQHFQAGEAAAPDRLVIGVNPKDIAVNKGPRGCHAHGDTCLAAKPWAYCETRNDYFGPYKATHVYGFDFSESKENADRIGGFWENHAMLSYLKRDDWPRLLDALINDATPEDETTSLCGVES